MADTGIQGEERGDCYTRKTDRNVECQVENRIQTSSSHPFITICSLKQLFSEDQFPTNAPQWTADCLSSRMLTALTGMSC